MRSKLPVTGVLSRFATARRTRPEARRRLVADLESLPPLQRRALHLREEARLSRTQIAERMGLREADVERLLVRARIGLAERATARRG